VVAVGAREEFLPRSARSSDTEGTEERSRRRPGTSRWWNRRFAAGGNAGG